VTALSDPPQVVVLTTFSADEYVFRALEAGAAGFLVKDPLTDREREVLVAVGRGLSNAEIGRELHLSEATVKTHVSRLLLKLGCANRVQVAILAHDAGLLES
jgi:DNA-binding NarL/FixJ family response regulator